MFVPLLVNVAWPATCNFRTNRDDVFLIDCKDKYIDIGRAEWEEVAPNGKFYWYVMKVQMIISYIWAVCYNLKLTEIVKIDDWYTQVKAVVKSRRKGGSRAFSPRSDEVDR